MSDALDPQVYFLRPVGAEGPIKIGTSYRPALRLHTYMRWSPYPLEIVATIRGPRSLELRFHAKFAEQHTHFEWFAPSAELTETIRQVAAGTFDVASLPPGIWLHNRPHRGRRMTAAA